MCGNNKTFIDEEYSDLVVTSDGNVMLTNARQGYDGKTLTCTRNCSDHHPQEHKITISIESTLLLLCVYVCVSTCACVYVHVLNDANNLLQHGLCMFVASANCHLSTTMCTRHCNLP